VPAKEYATANGVLEMAAQNDASSTEPSSGIVSNQFKKKGARKK